MNGEYTHDDLLFNILKEEGQIVPFLDAIFGFLYRRTDFYIKQENPSLQLGFPPEVAEQAVRDTFRKWQKKASDIAHEDKRLSVACDMTDLVVHEEEVVTTGNSLESAVESEQHHHSDSECERHDDLGSNTYNGADCGNYRWSQTAVDVDIEVPIPSNVTKSSEVQVDIKTCQLSVKVQDSKKQWNILLDEQLSHRHLTKESIWTLLPGKYITIHLQKSVEQWWDSLLTREEKLDLTKLDITRHLTDLPEEDHMQVEKVMVQEERNRLGLVSPDHQDQLDKLKKAWNIEGSPFKGTQFDPSVLQFPP